MTSAHSAQEGPGGDIEPTSPEDHRWNQDYEQWKRTRLDRIQASAGVWLGVLTTLLGLLGSVVLFKGGDLVTGVTASAAFQVSLIVLIVLVFVCVVLAVIAGGAATWGGLMYSELPADLATGVTPDAYSNWRHLFFRVFAFLALKPPKQSVRSGEAAWERYKRGYQNSAERNLTYLRASRKLGVAAAALIALLTIVAIIAGTTSPAPSVVIVVHHGQLTCGPVNDNIKYIGVTQVISVSNC